MVFFRKYIIDKKLESTQFKFWIGNNCGKDWYDVQHVGNTIEMKFIKQFMIKSGDVVFDCGAHQGYTSLLFSDWASPVGKVYSFEPYPSNFDILCENIKLNKSLNVFPYNVALGKQDGRGYVTKESNSSIATGKSGIQVKMACLDNYLGLKPDFIKIDVEGFELQVLQGASKILSKGETKFAIEIHPKEMKEYLSTVNELLSFIDPFRFERFIQWDDNLAPTIFKGEHINDRVHLFLIPSY